MMAAQMAADGGLRRLFEKPLPENPTLLDALLAWNHREKPVDPASFTEIFGELHFQEKPEHRDRGVLPPPSPSSWVVVDAVAEGDKSKDDSSLDALLRPPTSTVKKKSASFCAKKSPASLLLCTEGLGSESAVDADDMLKDGDGDADAAALVSGHGKDGGETDGREAAEEQAAAAAGAGERNPPLPPPPSSFPPPIRSVGRVGNNKPSVCFRSSRAGGRFVLVEVPGKELLQAYREDGRLRLRFADDKEMHGGDHQDDDEARKPRMDEDDKC